ncbi:MAG: restriction endonuclease subunit S [Bacilli bacterium]|nr:restriction endonuclease subunit S [Bacilli bacterium]
MNEKNVPKIRFQGFNEPWKQCKLGDVIDYIVDNRGKNPKYYCKSGIPVIDNYMIKNTLYPNLTDANRFIDDYLFNNFIRKYNEADDILITLVGNGIGNISLFPREKAVIIQNTLGLRTSENKIFLFFLLMKKNKDIVALDRGMAQPSIRQDELLDIDISIPTYKEQEQIGNFFKKLDNLISLHQRKLEHLKKQKKGLLQKMFPKAGAKVPEIRFPEFTGDWEQRKLSEVMKDFIVPMRDKPKEFGGTIPWTRIEDIEGKYLNGSLSGQYVTEETISKMNLKIIPKNSLIVSASATFGVVAVVTRDLITNQTFIGLVPNEEYDLDYLYSFFQSPFAKKYMKEKSAGSTIFYISQDDFKKMIALYPCLKEQKKIGNFFSKLDNLISLHQRKLDHLQKQKKALLQQIFI